MGSIPDQFPISLRAWPPKDDKAAALTSLISRINTERGNFRNVTEESLEEEIRQSELGIDNKQDNEASDEDDEGEEPDRLKALTAAREEILGQLEQAHNASMVTLDFVSLLLSKDTPVQASLSISPALRDAVGLGTLGVDKVQESRVSKTQKEENRRIALGWKLQSLTDTVDSLLASATRLEKEIETETKYWEHILTVSQKGWAICRLPQERHTLGVRFGFAESAPAFRNRSLAALRRNTDGTISLDQGIADSTPKRVRIRIQTTGITTGESHPSTKVPDPTAIESLILSARNTIFEEELWQELNREARILANQGARLTGDEISCPITATKRIILDLVSIHEEQVLSLEKRDDTIAEMISLSLHLLLSYAHKQNLRRRSQPPLPLSNRPVPNPPYGLLRPILARLHYQDVESSLTTLLKPLSKALISTGVVESSYSMKSTSPKSNNSSKSIPERTIESLISNLEAEFTLPISNTPSQSLSITMRTIPFPLDTRFHITATGPLAASCRPPPNPSSVGEVKIYILWAVACGLAAAFDEADSVNSLDSDEAGEKTEIGEPQDSDFRGWHKTHDPTALRKVSADEYHNMDMGFKAVIPEEGKLEIRMLFKYRTESSDESPGKISKPATRRFVWKGATESVSEDRSLNKIPLKTVVKELEESNGVSRNPGYASWEENYETTEIVWEDAS